MPVDHRKLKDAIAKQLPVRPSKVSKTAMPYYLLDSKTPSAILGPLMGGSGPCLDPISCSPATFAVVNPILVGAMSKGVLPVDNSLLYLLESTHSQKNWKRGGEEGGKYSFE